VTGKHRSTPGTTAVLADPQHPDDVSNPSTARTGMLPRTSPLLSSAGP